jgi:tetratricopeptide (TPR) repeat protein
MGISLALAARTRGRNHEWRSSEALFAAGVVALPNNAKLHYNLAHVTCKGVSQALTQAQNAHTAKAKRALKKWKRCRKLYEEAVRLAPDFQEAHGALGSLVVDSDLQLGLEHLEVALALDPHSKIAQKNIGDALGRKQVDIPRAKLHLYGKHEARPGRKMGHYTVCGDSVDAALNEALALRAILCPHISK